MTPFSIARVPFVAVVAAVAAIALAVVVVGVELNLGIWSLALLAIPGAVAGVYLYGYYQSPEPAMRVAASAGGGSVDLFEDPVEEADRLASGDPSEGSDAPPAGPDGSSEGDGPVPSADHP